MLQQLFIRNYAIIDSIKINFTGSLNIITGETGAGKSILMGALGLILGDRADTSVLLEKNEKCVVEGQFENNPEEVSGFLKQNDLDEDTLLIIRREISPSGKSRAFINDTPVTLNQLKDLAAMLVDMHRQFEIQNLNKSDFQLQVLDSLAGNVTLISDYKSCFERFRNTSVQLEKLVEEQTAENKEYDYTKFLFEELNHADFKENEIEQAESELKMMEHAEGIKENLSRVTHFLKEGEEPVIQQLKSVLNGLESIKSYVPELDSLTERLKSSWIELKDISDELESVNDKVSFSEAEMSRLNERMDLAYTLLKKHGAKTTEELLKIRHQLEKKLERSGDLSNEIEHLKKQNEVLESELVKIASQLSQKRRAQLPSFSKKVNQLLRNVGMPNASFKVNVMDLEIPGTDGMDKVEFLFNANKTDFQPIAKVASGGELSRLMLIIKSLVAGSMQMPTLIFDEIDSGISGEAAKQVGNIIKDLSRQHQILLITHQAQIAAKAYTHFFVFKENRDGRILTGIRLLNKEERIKAIATMLSGDKPTPAAFENAREMMN